MIPLDDALKLVAESIRPLQAVKAKLEDAPGCCLASDVRAQIPNPCFDNSQMDGYAVLSADITAASRTNPAVLEVIDRLAAGRASDQFLKNGQAVKIMTGAPMPKGADAIVAVEDTELTGNSVKIFHAAKKGEFVRNAGEDIKQGDTIMRKGQMVGPAEILALANQGMEEVEVVRRPKVAIIATGDELAYPGQRLEAGHIYNSSSPMLAALLRSFGAVPFDQGIVPDDPKLVAEKLCEALGFDMILLTGGVSVGDYDVNRNVLSNMGWREIFWKVAIKPGKPLAFGLLEGKPVFGLPGNPISTMTASRLFAREAIGKMTGCSNGRCATARLANDVLRDSRREQLLLAAMKCENGSLIVEAAGPQNSAHIKPALTANCLARIPAGEGVEPKGSLVNIPALF